MKVFQKQPGDTLDYDIDLSDFLDADDTITGVAKSVDDNGLTIGDTIVDNDAKLIKQQLSGGEDGTTYQVTMRISFTRGQLALVKEVDFKVKVKEL